MKKYLLALAACVLTSFGYAVGTEGDIRSIQAVPFLENWTMPKTVGETFYVRVRLLNHNWIDAMSPSGSAHPWVIERNGAPFPTLPSDLNDVLYRPALRLAIGARKVNAILAELGPEGELNGLNPQNNFYTDLYFSYKVKEGDLGLPVRLVNAEDKIITEASEVGSTGLYLVNVNTKNHSGGYWNLYSDEAQIQVASFWFGPTVPNPDPLQQPNRSYPDSAIGDAEHMDYDQIFPGVKVQTIDFDGEDLDVWRSVYKGSEDAVGVAPAVTGFGSPSTTEPTTVYIWSEDESIVVPFGTTEAVVHPDGKTRHVLKVTLPGKVATAEDIPTTIFKLKGADTAQIGATTKIHLCSAKSPATHGTGVIVEGSTITRTVQIVEDKREPLVKIVRANDDKKTFTSEATADITGTQMKVVLTKPYTKDLTVKLNYTKDENYFKVLQTGDATVDASIDEISIAKGDTVAYFTLYPLGSTDDLKTTGVTIKPTVDAEAAAFFTGGLIEAVAKITDQKPVVEIVGAPMTIVTGQEVEIDVKAVDNWSDLQPAIFTAGHKVQVQVDGQNVYEGTIHFTEDSTAPVKFTVPTTILDDETTLQVRGQDGTHGTSWGEWATYPVKVTSVTATPTLFETDDPTAAGINKGIVNEGEALNIRAVLSRPSGETLYAYLRPANDATAALVVVSKAGAEINPDSAYPLVSDLIPLTLLDGDGLATPATKVKLNLVLTKKPEWTGDAADVVTTYGCKDLAFAVTNVQPSVLSVTRDGTTVENGGTITVASSTEIAFTLQVNEPGRLDLEDTDKPIEVKWWFPEAENAQLEGQGDIYELGTVDATGKMTTEELVFPDENTTYKGYILLRDRDDANYGSDVWDPSKRAFAFNVKAGKEPVFEVVFPVGNSSGVYYENNSEAENRFTIKPSEIPAFSPTVNKPFEVELTVKSYNQDDGKILIYSADDEDPVPAETITLKFTKKSQFTSGKEVCIASASQNGGSDKGGSRFKIYTKVLNTETRPDGQKWCDYFSKGDQPRGSSYLRMVNIAPTLKLMPGDAHSFGVGATNRWTAGETVSLKWTTSDILRDLTNGVFTIEWDILDAEGNPSHTVVDTDVISTKTLGATASGLFTFTVPDTPFMAVHVNANDGEGGLSEVLEFFIQVAQTKKIAVNVAGPSLQSSTKYIDAEGLGKGHIYVDESTGQHLARQFRQTWYYNESAKQAHIYATGYKAGDVDDGKLGTADGYIGAALNPNGNKWTAGDYYTVPTIDEDGYNSFFYRWATLTLEGEVTLLAPDPAANRDTVVDRRFLLDNEKPDEGTGYGTVEIEAIFSREYLPGDHAGDINADGVPDIVVKRYAIGGSTRGTMPEDDFADLSEENLDNDFLPETGRYLFNSIVPGIKDKWTTGINPFTAKMEVRGIGEGLNDALVKLGIPGAKAGTRNYTRAEMMAWEEAGFAEDWSPENPTDPTLEDTDKDGLPDGYEYYYWYWAHVGTFDELGSGTNWTHLTGERYDVFNPTKGKLISWQEIENLLNPTKHYGNNILDKDLIDTDGDGLPDLLEFDLGTNPVHWDTDGDGVPDGWEVFFSGSDPLASDAGSNPDGDFMAILQIPSGYTIYTVKANEKGRELAYAVPNGALSILSTQMEKRAWCFKDRGQRYAILTDLTDAATEEEIEDSYKTYFKGTQSEELWNEDHTEATTNAWCFLSRGDYKNPTFTRANTCYVDPAHSDDESKDEDGNVLPDDKRELNRGVMADLDDGLMIRGKPVLVKLYERVVQETTAGRDADFNERTFQVMRYGKREDVVGNNRFPVYVMADYQKLPEGSVIVKEGVVGGGNGTPHLYYIHHMVYQRNGFYFPEPELVNYEKAASLSMSSSTTTSSSAEDIVNPTKVDGLGGLILNKDMGTGFNPLTAWYSTGAPHNKVASRWLPPTPGPKSVIFDSSMISLDGSAVDTQAFGALDEFLIMNWHHVLACGQGSDPKKIADLEEDMDPASQKNVNKQRRINAIWGAYTTKNGQKTYKTDGTANHAAAADTDGDGVPDGWELYVACGPGTGYRQDPLLSNFFHHNAVLNPMAPPQSPSDDVAADYNTNPITGNVAADMSVAEEFRGTDSCKAYENCPSIGEYLTPKIKTEDIKAQLHYWFNKFWPTDPWSSDTDCDGLDDYEEGTFSCYGSRTFKDEKSDNGTLFCLPGGGLNPCSWDTDMDGLPDKWEAQFEGRYITPNVPFDQMTMVERRHYETLCASATFLWEDMEKKPEFEPNYCFVVGGMDGTVVDSYSMYTAGDGHEIHSVNNDFDYDGLDPWQEYMTGVIRAFRYDDVLSPWTIEERSSTNRFTAAELEEYLVTGKPLSPLWARVTKMRPENPYPEYPDYEVEFVDELEGGSNPNLIFNVFDSFTAYGSVCRRKWDLVRGRWYYFPDGPNHCLRMLPYATKLDGYPTYSNAFDVESRGNTYNAYDAEIEREFGVNKTNVVQRYVMTGADYASCDPREFDTDGDGMDDYYELFHGLNPLYGGETGRDLVANMWGNPYSFNAKKNYWTERYKKEGVLRGASDEEKLYDFAHLPWMAGDPAADPDGDDVRNIDEAIQVNAQAKETYLHTDPSPLWLTSVDNPQSPVRQYYRTRYQQYRRSLPTYTLEEVPGLEIKEPVDYVLPDAAHIPEKLDAHYWLADDYNYDFEINEGYDSDHDGVSDGQEGKSSAEGKSDPQDSADPYRRQAMYFPGKDSALQARIDPTFAVSSNSDHNFLQFTIECWVKPEGDLKREQVILERVIAVENSNPNDANLLRRNFQLGMKDGYFYAAYDPNGTSAMRVMAMANQPVRENTWTHIAASYDGAALRLFLNGTAVKTTSSSLHPTTRANKLITAPYWHVDLEVPWLVHDAVQGRYDSAIIYGASASGDPEEPPVFDLLAGKKNTSWKAYTKFFQGYLDEVRLWDGVRDPSTEIAANYLKRFKREDLLANRNAIYDAWRQGATRSVNRSDVSVELPAELVYHYNFSSVFAAASADELAKVPFGFDAPTSKAALARPEDWVNPWLTNLVVRSTAYTADDYMVWIPNSYAHLPRFDGTTRDSVYWSEDYAGFYTTEELGFSKLAFPRTHELYTDFVTVTQNQMNPSRYKTRWAQLVGQEHGLDLQKDYVYTFAQHADCMDGTDLLPLGGAFVKYCPDYWDDQGATTTWAITGEDKNNNGIPDWWEAAIKTSSAYSDITDTTCKRYGHEMTLLDAYRRDLAAGAHESAASGDKQFAQTADENSNGLPDWWEKLYDLRGQGGPDDYDNDGLSNYVEFLLSEVFKLDAIFDPTQAYSANATTLDYFYPFGSIYVGELFTDHDMMEDLWEDQYAANPNAVSRLKYDSHVDSDNDGWSNGAEARYSQMSREISADQSNHYNSIDELQADYPIPAINMTVTYNGQNTLAVEKASLCIAATSDPTLNRAYDAQWTISGDEKSDDKESKDEVPYTFVIGRWSKRHVVGNLTPGNVKADSIVLQTSFSPSTEMYTWYLYNAWTSVHRGTLEEYRAAQRKHGIANVHLMGTSTSFEDMMINKRVDETAQTVTLTMDGIEREFCTINLKTGAFDIDLGAFEGIYRITGEDESSRVSCEDLYYRFGYSANPSVGMPRQLYLGLADSGHVREGKNAFVVWAETINENGEFDPGEPFGFVNDVDVGWNTAKATVELTETHPVFGRINLLTGENDREYWWGAESGNYTNVVANPIPSERKVRVRVVRTLINEEHPIAPREQYVDDEKVYIVDNVNMTNDMVVLDKYMDLTVRNYLHEGDFLTEGKFDIDWMDDPDNHGLSGAILASAKELEDIDPWKISYRIVFGEGSVDPSETNVISKVLFARSFDMNNTRTIARPYYMASGSFEGGVVTKARPTLQWIMDHNFNSYPAFRIAVYKDAALKENIWTSPIMRAPTTSTPLADGTRVFSYDLPVAMGEYFPGTKNMLENDAEYYWTVMMYNAKFREFEGDDSWCYKRASIEPGKFRLAIPTDTNARGTAPMRVKYFGPKATFETPKAPIRVQAFASPDFAGEPVAGAVVTNMTALTDTSTDKNATICGIPAGTYYFRAYIDSNDDGICQPWESKGYLCGRGEIGTVAFNPTGVSFSTDRLGNTPILTVYIEDADTDNDCLPDGWEMAMAGVYDRSALEVRGTETLLAGTEDSKANAEVGLSINKELVGELTRQDSTYMAAGGMAGMLLRSIRQPEVAGLILGLEPGADGKFTLPQPTVLENGLTIKGLSLNPAAGTGTITVAAETTGGVESMGPLASAIYAGETTAKVVLKVERAATLGGDWQTAGSVEVTISAGALEREVSFSLDTTASAGFFRVSIEQ